MTYQINIFYIIAIFLLIIGCLNWGCVGAFEFSLIECGIKTKLYRRIIYVLIGISALYLLFRKSLWFPNYGETLIPEKMLTIKEPSNYTKILKIKIKAGKKILYWTDDDINYGITIGDTNNYAKMKLNIKENTKTKLYYRKYRSPILLGDVKTIDI